MARGITAAFFNLRFITLVGLQNLSCKVVASGRPGWVVGGEVKCPRHWAWGGGDVMPGDCVLLRFLAIVLQEFSLLPGFMATLSALTLSNKNTCYSEQYWGSIMGVGSGW